MKNKNELIEEIECIQERNCDILLTITSKLLENQTKSESDQLIFYVHLNNPLEISPKRLSYISVGLSMDTQIGHDLLVDCLSRDIGRDDKLNHPTIKISFNHVNNSNLKMNSGHLSNNVGASFSDHQLKCVWSLNTNLILENRIKSFKSNGSDNYFNILLSVGQIDSKMVASDGMLIWFNIEYDF